MMSNLDLSELLSGKIFSPKHSLVGKWHGICIKKKKKILDTLNKYWKSFQDMHSNSFWFFPLDTFKLTEAALTQKVGLHSQGQYHILDIFSTPAC